MELEPTNEYEDSPKPTTPGRPPKYPWSEWTNGKPHLITRGQEFTHTLKDMNSILHTKARTSGQSVNVSQSGIFEKIIFQFYPKGELPPKLPSFSNLIVEQTAEVRCQHCNKGLMESIQHLGVCARFVLKEEVNEGIYTEYGYVDEHTGEFLGW